MICRAEAGIVVERSAKDVYAFVAEAASDPSWRDEVVESVLVSGEPGRGGARYREVFSLDGQLSEWPVEIAEASAPHRVSFFGDTPRVAMTFSFVPVGEATRVTLCVEATLAGPATLLAPVVGSTSGAWRRGTSAS